MDLRKIFHLRVGNADYKPTDEELRALEKRFGTEGIFAFDQSLIFVQSFDIPTTQAYQLQVGIGGADSEPTQNEIDKIIEQFQAACQNNSIAVVATRNDVNVAVNFIADAEKGFTSSVRSARSAD